MNNLPTIDLIKKSRDASIRQCNNGYVLCISGYAEDDQWVSMEIVATDLNQVLQLLQDWSNIPKES